jgi:hypothetical protein
LLHIGFFGKYLKKAGGDDDAQREFARGADQHDQCVHACVQHDNYERNQWNYWKVQYIPLEPNLIYHRH